jgi:hypothetical protein
LDQTSLWIGTIRTTGKTIQDRINTAAASASTAASSSAAAATTTTYQSNNRE